MNGNAYTGSRFADRQVAKFRLARILLLMVRMSVIIIAIALLYRSGLV